MAVSFVWPGSLPQQVTVDYEEDGGARLLRTPVDAGVAKLRRRGRRPSAMVVSMFMSAAQIVTFETFVLSTIRGTTRFGFPHPRLQIQAEVRLVPEEGGKLYRIAYVTPVEWRVSFALEVLP